MVTSNKAGHHWLPGNNQALPQELRPTSQVPGEQIQKTNNLPYQTHEFRVIHQPQSGHLHHLAMPITGTATK